MEAFGFIEANLKLINFCYITMLIIWDYLPLQGPQYMVSETTQRFKGAQPDRSKLVNITDTEFVFIWDCIFLVLGPCIFLVLWLGFVKIVAITQQVLSRVLSHGECLHMYSQ